ncbi:hypothetical protein SAMN04487936_101502 [Halobacillus dabanensis]|uniref:Uncharacterized protein n=1 Tax=Halobacillus dabanensis TaxID=240302 RepID=A0A1I3Q1L2_HALDA|nr:hypothetical protein [Halobacillus dabanensis]SFJ27585.1 hypothetical protein SAMN04487936_101502 [Halobacillus dabanensis]
MLKIFMVIVTVILCVGYTFVLYKKRKDMENPHGWKSYVTPFVFIFAPVFALLSYIFGFVGIVTWLVLGVGFITASFFTKYLPEPKGSQ